MEAYLDAHTKIAHILYKGHLTPAAYRESHEWLQKLQADTSKEQLRGILGDFRQVRSFDKGFVLIAKRLSGAETDEDIVPFALLVTPHQEQMVTLAMSVDSVETRKRVVTSEKEAYCFIDEWNDVHKRGFNSIGREYFSDVTIFNRYLLLDLKNSNERGS